MTKKGESKSLKRRTSDGLPYTVTYKRIRNLILRVERDGEIRISAPYGTTEGTLRHFVETRRSWVEERLALLSEVPQFLDGARIHLLGRSYGLTIRESSREKGHWSEEGLVLESRLPEDPEHNRKLFYRQFEVLTERTFRSLLDSAGGREVTLKLRNMTRRWGTCFVDRATIQLNRKLIHAPKELIHYVVIHELVHFSHPDHGQGFHAELSRRIPDWKARRKRLNREYGGYL